MHKILISRCLLGEKVRYDGGDNLLDNPILRTWQQQSRLVPICPEVAGTLPTPRPPAERIFDVAGNKVITISGDDVTEQFNLGAQAALSLCQRHQIKLAILKQSSPSCGSEQIYDGRFVGQKIPGQGVTTELLRQHGIAVFGEDALADAEQFLMTLEQQSTQR